MSTFLTRHEVRDLDRRATLEFGMPGLVLMENAGRGAADLLYSLGIHGRVVICCGKGNNGGDGLVMARWLVNCEIEVLVHLFARPEELSPEAAAQWRIVEKAGISRRVYPGPDVPEQELVLDFARAEWLVDALFGTGLAGPVRPPFDRIIGLMNASPAAIFAVDIPSGLDADTGEPLGPTIRAMHTVTFVAPKKGYQNPAARSWLGQVHTVDIGVPAVMLAMPRRERAGPDRE